MAAAPLQIASFSGSLSLPAADANLSESVRYYEPMPKTQPRLNSEPALLPPISDVDELRRRVREAEERSLEYWIEAVVVSAAGSMTVKKLQDSFSWRVTRPLRAARTIQRKVQETGVRRTFGIVLTRIAQIRQARKRG